MILDEPPAPVLAPEAPGPPDAERLALADKAAWTVVWIAVLAVALNYWGSWPAGPLAALLAPALALVAVVGAATVWLARRPMGPGARLAGLGAAVVTVLASQGTDIHTRHGYTTDSGAFNQVATRLLVAGHDPYTSSMAPAARLLHPAFALWTYRVDGSHVLQVSYPAGSFLLQAPLWILGVHHQLTDWVDLVAWLATAVLVFCLLPATLRWAGPLLLVVAGYSGAFANGGTDALFLPFLVVAVWRWDRYPHRAAARLPAWVGPVALGLACTVKQTPWFCVPFLVVGVALAARRAGGRPVAVGARYAATVGGAFLVVNLPFLLWNPGAWLRGVLLPFVDPLVPDGQGVVALALHGLTGGVVVGLLAAAGAAAYLALLAAFFWWEPRLRRAWLLLLPLVLYVPARSLANYLLDLAPAALVAAASVRAPAPAAEPDPAGRPVEPGRRWPRAAPWTVAVPAAAAVVLAGVALTSAPLGVSVLGVSTSDGAQTLDAVTVAVHNGSSGPLAPRFMVASGAGHPDGFWPTTVRSGTFPVGPGATTVLVLHAPRPTGAPARGASWLVQAYTTTPAALSTSPLLRWSLGPPAQ